MITKRVEVTKADKNHTDRDINIKVVTTFNGGSEQGETIGITKDLIPDLIMQLLPFVHMSIRDVRYGVFGGSDIIE